MSRLANERKIDILERAIEWIKLQTPECHSRVDNGEEMVSCDDDSLQWMRERMDLKRFECLCGFKERKKEAEELVKDLMSLFVED
jgi:hypothetical protein